MTPNGLDLSFFTTRADSPSTVLDLLGSPSVLTAEDSKRFVRTSEMTSQNGENMEDEDQVPNPPKPNVWQVSVTIVMSGCTYTKEELSRWIDKRLESTSDGRPGDVHKIVATPMFSMKYAEEKE